MRRFEVSVERAESIIWMELLILIKNTRSSLLQQGISISALYKIRC